jgi:UDP-glucose 4-epimerase
VRVLLTGAAGYLGRAIYVRLLPEHDVRGLDRNPASTVKLVGDLGDQFLLSRALRDVDAVIHTAALHAPQVGFSSNSEFERINVECTKLLASMAADAGVRCFVYTSTTALYGAASQHATSATWVDEGLAPQPVTIYHRTKISAETSLAAVARSGMSVTILRVSRCFPEPAPVMASYRLHRGIDARDVADAHALALQNELPGLRRYVISATTPFQREDMEALQKDAPGVISLRAPELAAAFAQRGWQLPRTIDRVYSSQLATRMLNWKPRYGFEEVLHMLDARSSDVLPPQHHSLA